MRRRSVLAAGGAAGLLAMAGRPRRALAAPSVRTTGLNWLKNGQLAVSVGLQDLFWRRDVERLTSGFATRVFIRVLVMQADGKQIVSQTFRHSEIVYDLWDEKFRILRQDAGRTAVTLEAATASEAMEQAVLLVKFPVADRPALVPGVPYRVHFRGDLNPLSADVLADVRRWLAPRPGQGRQGADSFFGSFVSIFVNPQIEESERQVVFFSQAFAEVR